jgi:hypothetical protein
MEFDFYRMEIGFEGMEELFQLIKETTNSSLIQEAEIIRNKTYMKLNTIELYEKDLEILKCKIKEKMTKLGITYLPFYGDRYRVDINSNILSRAKKYAPLKIQREYSAYVFNTSVDGKKRKEDLFKCLNAANEKLTKLLNEKGD